jgi:hypothetical protein
MAASPSPLPEYFLLLLVYFFFLCPNCLSNMSEWCSQAWLSGRQPIRATDTHTNISCSEHLECYLLLRLLSLSAGMQLP